MADRWEGIIRAFISGYSCPARVMASLLVSPKSCTLQQPSKNAILFMGDCVPDSGNPTIERLSRLETVSSILLSKLGDPLANVWVVEAPRFDGPFACYEGFLPSMSPRGDPLSYDPHNFPASTAIISMFRGCLCQVSTGFSQMNNNDGKLQVDEKNKDQQGCIEDALHSLPKTLLFGFSKGGVVLNQLLSEMSHECKNGQDYSKEWRIETQERSHEGEQAFYPTTAHGFLASIVEIHFLDVGLNCRGAYQTDIDVLENVVKAAGASTLGLYLGFHGTPRQWKDSHRPWIASEKDFCISFLRKKAEEEGNAKLVVSERLYFKDKKPSLQMHFEILEHFEVIL